MWYVHIKFSASRNFYVELQNFKVHCLNLPSFLYLFRMIPPFLPKSMFSDLDSHISAFVWNRSKLSLKIALLEMPWEKGGLGLPNFMFYYWSANIAKLM